jgi:hypothetical protein
MSMHQHITDYSEKLSSALKLGAMGKVPNLGISAPTGYTQLQRATATVPATINMPDLPPAIDCFPKPAT